MRKQAFATTLFMSVVTGISFYKQKEEFSRVFDLVQFVTGRRESSLWPILVFNKRLVDHFVEQFPWLDSSEFKESLSAMSKAREEAVKEEQDAVVNSFIDECLAKYGESLEVEPLQQNS